MLNLNFILGQGPSRTRQTAKQYPGEDEPLHAYIQGDTDEQINKARSFIELLINDPYIQDKFRRQQLKALAKLQGTWKDEPIVQACPYCKGTLHSAEDCPYHLMEEAQQKKEEEAEKANEEADNKETDQEYLDFVKELPGGVSLVDSGKEQTKNEDGILGVSDGEAYIEMWKERMMDFYSGEDDLKDF